MDNTLLENNFRNICAVEGIFDFTSLHWPLLANGENYKIYDWHEKHWH